MNDKDNNLTKTARRIAASLLTNGFGEKAARLKLLDADERDLGGWNKRAVGYIIRRELLKAKTKGLI